MRLQEQNKHIKGDLTFSLQADTDQKELISPLGKPVEAYGISEGFYPVARSLFPGGCFFLHIVSAPVSLAGERSEARYYSPRSPVA